MGARRELVHDDALGRKEHLDCQEPYYTKRLGNANGKLGGLGLQYPA